MTKFAITLCIALAISIGHSQVTQPSTSVRGGNTISWWSRIRHPILSIQNSLKMKIDDILNTKRSNDESSHETQLLCDNLKIIIDGIAREIQQKDGTLKIDDIAKLVPKEKVAECVALYTNWKNKGLGLLNRLSKCRNDGMTAIGNYGNSLRDIEEIFPKVEDYRNQIEACDAFTGFLSCPKSLGCTLWVYFKWIFFAAEFPAKMALSTAARENLVRCNYEMRNLDECNANSEAVQTFFDDGKDITTQTHDCIIRQWSAHVHGQ